MADWYTKFKQQLAKDEGSRGRSQAIEGGGPTRGLGITSLPEAFKAMLLGKGAKADTMSDRKLFDELVDWHRDEVVKIFGKSAYDKLPTSVKGAAIDLHYNLGNLDDAPSFVTAAKAGNYEDAARNLLDVVSANDPKTNKNGVLRGLANRRVQHYNNIADQNAFRRITDFSISASNQEGKQTLVSYKTNDGSSIDFNFETPLHSASGSLDKPVDAPVEQQQTMPDESAVEQPPVVEQPERPVEQQLGMPDESIVDQKPIVQEKIVEEPVEEAPIGAVPPDAQARIRRVEQLNEAAEAPLPIIEERVEQEPSLVEDQPLNIIEDRVSNLIQNESDSELKIIKERLLRKTVRPETDQLPVEELPDVGGEVAIAPVDIADDDDPVIPINQQTEAIIRARTQHDAINAALTVKPPARGPLNPWGGPVPIQVPRTIDQWSEIPKKGDGPSFFETVSDTLGYQYAPMLDAIKNQLKYRDDYDPNYKPMDDMDGFEEHALFLVNAQNKEHMADLKEQLRQNQERRERLYQASLPQQFFAGIFDPINLVALPFGGPSVSLGRAFLRSGTSVAALQTGLEAIRTPFDPLATPAESAMNIGSAFVIGGTIGTLFSIPASRRANVIKKTEEQVKEFTNELDSLSPQDIAKVGGRELRELGNKTDFEVQALRTRLPKEIEGIDAGLAKLAPQIQKARSALNAELARLQELRPDVPPKRLRSKELTRLRKERDTLEGKETALKTTKNELEIDLDFAVQEERLRKVEAIQDLKANDPYNLVENAFTNSFLYKGVTTGMKRALQSKSPSTVKEAFVKLAGDSGMLLKLNQYGFATPKSVHQYAATRNGEWLKVYVGMLQQFGEHTKRGVTVANDVVLSNIDGSFTAYVKEVNRKYVMGERGATTAENESIQAMSQFYKTWEKRLKEVGILGDVAKIPQKIVSLERRSERIRDKIFERMNQIQEAQAQDNVQSWMVDSLNGLRTRLSAIENKIREEELSLAVARDGAGAPEFEEAMFPRYWNRDEIRARRQEFAEILKQHYRDNPFVYIKNEAAFDERRVNNISELSSDEVLARYGKKFNIKEFVDDTSGMLKVLDGQTNLMGRWVKYNDDTEVITINKPAVFDYYKQMARAMKDPDAAYKKLMDEPDAGTYEGWWHRKFIMDNWDFFRSFNDMQDFIIAHEMHHTKFNKLTKTYKQRREDNIDLENKTDKAALAWLKNERVELRKRQPLFMKQELDVSEQALSQRVDETIDNILGLTDVANDMNAYYGAGKSKHFRHRSLDIPNSKVFDFIQNDPLAVMRAYTKRVAPQYEFAKMYHGKSVEEVLDDIEADMSRTGSTQDEINARRKDFLHLYDRVVGTVLREPHSWDQRTATVLRDLAQLNYLGSAGFATLPDFAKIMMEHELKDVFRGLFGVLSDGRVRMSAQEGKLAGEILEIIMGESHMRLVDDVTNNPFDEGTYQKYVGKLKWGFYQANLLAPMTNIMKKFDAVVRGHSLIQMSVRLAGGEKAPTKFEIEYLARYGIDKAKAQKIKELVDAGIIERTEGGLYLPNTEKWPDTYKDIQLEFRSSLNSGIMNTILMGTPADKPNIVDGVVYVPFRIAKNFGMKEDARYKGYARIENGLLGLPFQFYSYTLAAVNKITASYATGQARNRAVALAASMGLAYMGLELKNPDFVMDNMPIEDKIARSFDMSGAAALYTDVLYTSMHTSLALGGPDISMGLLQPKFPQEKNYLDAIAGVAGAGPSIGLDIASGLHEFAFGERGEGAKQVVRSLPTARLWIWKDFMNEATNAFTAKRF